MAKERIFSIDALRGFSLLGIILMNILTFAYPYQVINPFEFFQHQDGALFKVSSLFIIASFYPIFAFEIIKTLQIELYTFSHPR